MPLSIGTRGMPCLPRGIVSQGTLPTVPMLVGMIVSPVLSITIINVYSESCCRKP